MFFAAELGFGLSLHLTYIKSQRTKQKQKKQPMCLSFISLWRRHILCQIKSLKTGFQARKKEAKLRTSTLDWPSEEFHSIHSVYTKHTHAQGNTVFGAQGKVTKFSPQGFQAVLTHKSTGKINIKPSFSCHGSCPTLSQGEQTNLVWLLNRACRFVSHPYVYPSNKVSFNIWKE